MVHLVHKEKRFSVVERDTMCAARRVTVTSHTAELAHLYISERKSYYRTKIGSISFRRLVYSRLGLSYRLYFPFFRVRTEKRGAKYDRRTTCVDWRGIKLTVKPVLCCVACQQRGFRKAICSLQHAFVLGTSEVSVSVLE